MGDKISVVIPVHNVEPYLNKCIASIVCQSYTNLEIILVDDGSNDGSSIICDEWKEKDNRIQVVHKEYSGVSDARNLGISMATGEYIGFIDSDDYVHKDLYKTLYQMVKDYDCDMSICNYEYVDLEGKGIYPISDALKDEVLDKDEALDKLMISTNQYFTTVWNKLYKKELFNEIRFMSGLIQEDEYIAHHLIGAANKVATTKEVLVYYVQRNNSIMNKVFNIKRLDGAWAFYDRYTYMMERGKKENAYYALRQSYAVTLTVIEKLGVKKHKKEIKEVMKVLTKEFGLNPRTFKLRWIYFKKIFSKE